MKFIINIKWWLLLFAIIWSSSAFAQGIRKHYTELTDSDRIEYQTAIESLNDLNIREEFAGYHADPDDDDINGNVPQGHPDTDSPIHGVQEFLPWHRQFILEFEWEIQDQNEYLTIPYWDWTGESDPSGVNSNNTNSPLWTNSQISSLDWSSNFLGKYDDIWDLDRTFSGSLPTSSSVAGVLASTTFSQFRNIEGAIHGSPHVWVGGQMGNIFFSPRDPIFYFHHAMVDKIWQDWEVMPGNSSSFTDDVMPTFDGTVPGFNFVDQNSIIDSRSLGVFYSNAISQITRLEMYAVTNNIRPSEKFTYQYKIEAKDDFLIPAGKNAEFRSCKAIELLPGFKADNGAVFWAKIDLDCDFSTDESSALVIGAGDIYDENKAENIMIASSGSILPLAVKNFPNPFTDQTTIEFDLPEDAEVTLFVSDITGKQIARLLDNKSTLKGTHQLVFDASNYSAGMYYYTIQVGNEVVTQKMTLMK